MAAVESDGEDGVGLLHALADSGDEQEGSNAPVALGLTQGEQMSTSKEVPGQQGGETCGEEEVTRPRERAKKPTPGRQKTFNKRSQLGRFLESWKMIVQITKGMVQV